MPLRGESSVLREFEPHASLADLDETRVISYAQLRSTVRHYVDPRTRHLHRCMAKAPYHWGFSPSNAGFEVEVDRGL